MTTIGQVRVGMMDVATPENTTVLPAVLKRTVWGAVFAGALAAIGIQMILTVLGIALGVSGVDRGDRPESIGMMAGLWWLITGTVSLLLGGCVVGRMSGIQRSLDVLLHCFAMWAVTAVFGFLLLWSTAGVASAASANMANAVTRGWIPTPAAGRAQLDAGRTDAGADFTTGAPAAPGSTAPDARAAGRPSDTLTPVSAADLERAREAARTTSWWTLGGLLLGVAAALSGGWFASPHRILIRPSSVAAA